MTKESLRLGNVSLTSRKLRTIILSTFLLFSIAHVWGATYTYRLVVSKAALVNGRKYLLLANDRTKAYNCSVNNSNHLTTSLTFSSSSTEAGSAVTTTNAADKINYITLIHVSGDTYKLYDSGGKYITATQATSGGFSRANSDDNGWTFFGTSGGMDAIYEKAYSSKYACCRYRSSSSDFRSYQAASHTSASSSGAKFYLATGCSVTYNANGATSGTVPTDSYLYGEGGTVTVKSNSGSLAKTGGYTFGGWNTKADGSGTNFTAGSGTFTISQDTILYAKWVSSCANTVTINKGASTNCSLF